MSDILVTNDNDPCWFVISGAGGAGAATAGGAAEATTAGPATATPQLTGRPCHSRFTSHTPHSDTQHTTRYASSCLVLYNQCGGAGTFFSPFRQRAFFIPPILCKKKFSSINLLRPEKVKSRIFRLQPNKPGSGRLRPRNTACTVS